MTTSPLVTVIVSLLGSGATTVAVTLIMLKTRNVTDVAVATINADTQEDISQREALVKEQARLDAERARLDAVREGLEKGRSVEIGNLKLRVNGLEETLAAEREHHARVIEGLNVRIRELERQLVDAYGEIRDLQKDRRTGGAT